ncbi:TadA family conjugal transfer-associated ATPase [Nakamurella antarctica]|uniref:TadA family conjugal transfer-associated ATPase n=1 Tax=Nakamurella antarctica TaxID=1902245 RepID=A0A3G8ZYC5_9ACTN|nr:TadA family conjugal transfer-associated ATPase [Nakamurella antarctica]
MPAGLVERVQARLAGEGGSLTSASVARAVRAETGVLVSDAEMLRLIRMLLRELVGAGPLTSLLSDPLTTDVVVNGPDDVRVDRGDGWERVSVTFSGEEAVARLARRLAAAADRRLDDAHPYVDASLADGTRLHAVLAPMAASGTCLSLRVLRPTRYDLAALQHQGTFPGLVLPALRAVIQARLAFLVSGGTGTGKTTLLAALLGAVPESERIVTVEDAGELRPNHPHVVRLVARPENVEGAGSIELRELVRQALRMRPDRLIVGEVRGSEVVDLLAALNTGHEGGAGTVHANAVAEVPARLEALASLGGLDRCSLHAQLRGAVQVLIHLRRSVTGRVVSEIGVLVDNGSGLVQSMTAFDASGRPGPGAERLGNMLMAAEVDVPW